MGSKAVYCVQYLSQLPELVRAKEVVGDQFITHSLQELP